MNYFFSIRPPPLNAPHTALIKKLCRSILPLQCSLAALLSLRVTKTRRDMNKQRLRQGQRVETEARVCVCLWLQLVPSPERARPSCSAQE